ncbi:MAG TPA: hypothetical protein VER08_10320 [Pyrinomonadaceae bacterium]|nr:hypothetical protein [Pyrinomonadaceae bacterium]
MFKDFTLSRRALVAASVFTLLIALAPVAFAQESTTTPQTQTPRTETAASGLAQTDAAERSGAQVASAPAGEAAAATQGAASPLYREYKGVTLGMSAADVRAKLGKPQEKSDEMDFFVFSERERARVYYKDGKVSTVIATYIGKDAAAPTSAAVLGAEIDAKPDGSMYRMTTYPEAGYWVAYSRTPGEPPMVIITMQKWN